MPSPLPKTVLITSITGQDGSYLPELLLEKGHQVHGIKWRPLAFNASPIDHLYQDPHESNPRLTLHYSEDTDSTNLIRIIQQVQPDEIYKLGAQSHVAVSFESWEYTVNSDVPRTQRMLQTLLIPGLTYERLNILPLNHRAIGLGSADSPEREYAVLPPMEVKRGGLALLGRFTKSRAPLCLMKVPLLSIPSQTNQRRRLVIHLLNRQLLS